jgi:lipoprotein Spr
VIKLFNIYLIVSLLCIACQPSARYKTADTQIPSRKSADSNLNAYVNQWLGTPYEYGRMSKEGTDCSGFTNQVMFHVYNISIPRQAQDQYLKGHRVTKSRIEPGDLVFFSGIRSRGIDHVGIYLGAGKFAHASEKSGVMISSMDEEYYDTHYAGACRY